MGRVRAIIKPKNWNYLYLGLRDRHISIEDAVIMSGSSYYAIRNFVKEETLKEEMEEQKLSMIYADVMAKHNITQADIYKFNLIMEEAITMGEGIESIASYLGKQAKLKSDKKEITSFFNRTVEEERAEDQE